MKKIVFLSLLLCSPLAHGFDLVRGIFSTPQEEEIAIETARVAILYIGDSMSVKQTMFSLISIARNPEVDGIILMINCTGGSPSTFCMLHDLIKKISTMKPIISLITGVAFSGGYLLACSGEYIFAHSGANVGSIGVYAEIKRLRDLKLNGPLKALMEIEILQAGEFKALLNPHKDLTEHDKAIVQKEIEKTYHHFLTCVAQDRKLNIDEYKTWAEGRLFMADEALTLGLIDELGTLFEAEEKMLALIQEKNPTVLFDTRLEYQFYETKKKTDDERKSKRNDDTDWDDAAYSAGTYAPWTASASRVPF